VKRRSERGSASIWAILVIAGAFTMLLGLVVDGGRLIDARIAASHAAAQAARTGADALSGADVRSGYAGLDVDAARARAERYLHDTGLDGSIQINGQTVTVTVSGTSKTEVLGVIGISGFPIEETESATAITAQGAS
jgi:Flp pilus assembly protein TadG